MLIASLPMYDLPEVREATDAWWTGLAGWFREQGLDEVPERLQRGPSVRELWRSPSLLFSQTCGHPYSAGYRGDLRLLMTPCYRALGSEGPDYISLILVTEADPASTLVDLDGARFAVNGFDSWSGWHTLRRDLSCGDRDPDSFLRHVQISGTHRESIAAVRLGVCRACAVDAVTHALIALHAPAELDGLRVLAHTRAAPALPYVTHAGRDPRQVSRLRAGLRGALNDPALAPVRNTLCIRDALVLSDDDYLFMAAGGSGHGSGR